jgi:hypothetical protein
MARDNVSRSRCLHVDMRMVILTSGSPKLRNQHEKQAWPECFFLPERNGENNNGCYFARRLHLMCMYVCMYVCRHVCVYACMHVRVYHAPQRLCMSHAERLLAGADNDGVHIKHNRRLLPRNVWSKLVMQHVAQRLVKACHATCRATSGHSLSCNMSLTLVQVQYNSSKRHAALDALWARGDSCRKNRKTRAHALLCERGHTHTHTHTC